MHANDRHNERERKHVSTHFLVKKQSPKHPTATNSPQVAALTSALDKDFAGERKKIAELDLAPLLSASYVSMVDTELKRRTRTQVAVELHTEPLEGLFAGQQVPGWNVF